MKDNIKQYIEDLEINYPILNDSGIRKYVVVCAVECAKQRLLKPEYVEQVVLANRKVFESIKEKGLWAFARVAIKIVLSNIEKTSELGRCLHNRDKLMKLVESSARASMSKEDKPSCCIGDEFERQAKEYSVLRKAIDDDIIFSYLVSRAEECFAADETRISMVLQAMLTDYDITMRLIRTDKWSVLKEVYHSVEFVYKLRKEREHDLRKHKKKTGKKV